MILTDAELRDLTRVERPKAQARELAALGIPFKPRRDGSLVVSRAAAEAALGFRLAPPESGAANAPDAEAYEVNIDALRTTHGKAAQARRS